jgi:hypothetical protein
MVDVNMDVRNGNIRKCRMLRCMFNGRNLYSKIVVHIDLGCNILGCDMLSRNSIGSWRRKIFVNARTFRLMFGRKRGRHFECFGAGMRFLDIIKEY